MFSFIKNCYNSLKSPNQDGRCTCSPNGNYQSCCAFHDLQVMDSRIQKSSEMRLKADRNLRKCITDKGHPLIGMIYYYVVRTSATLHGGY